ncbi:50S ribosomal protein L11 methyltransferase [Salsipaludibacter albus]|uniref:50S ribosomal protein L11 methyltransferase n=1 Tax=Salsipaludibacter albus TaxID=2849650 RepID=UPI001EE4B054|nr:50S ribosomal protein L11 methyltransferase [Salsipaludibacter albus]
MTDTSTGAGTGHSGHWAATVPTGPGDDAEQLAARLWAVGALGVWERSGELVGYFPGPPDDFPDDQRDGLPDDVRWSHEPEVDHVAAWRAAARPVRAGAVEIVPDHLANSHDTPPGVHRILLDPGQAFGSGHHETTAGCLEVLAEVDPAGRSVLDLGTGTGILAIAAVLQGAASVLGVDTDPHAVAVARDNAHHNDVEVDLAVGALDDVDGRFDVVLANLLTATLVELADDLPGVMAPSGWLVASGVGTERAHVVADAFTRAGLRDVEVRPRGEWVVLVARAAT